MKPLAFLLLILPLLPLSLAAQVHLAVTPDTVQSGTAATLSWQADEAARVFISGVGLVEAADSLSVRPKETTTYTLVAEGASGVVSTQVRLTVTGGRDATIPTDFERFEYPIRVQHAQTSFAEFLDHVYRVLQDSLRFSLHAFQTPDKRFTFVTNLSRRSHLVGDDEPRIAKRQLSYLVEVEEPSAASEPIRYTIKTLIEFQRRTERTWRPEHDETMHRNEADRLRAYLER